MKVMVLDLPLQETDKNELPDGNAEVALRNLLEAMAKEKERRRNAQRIGIARAKERGVSFGRPRTELPEGFEVAYRAFAEKRLTGKEAASQCGMPVSTFYRKAMLLASKAIHVIHVSTHVSLREACDRVKKERVLKVIRLANEGMRQLGYENPRIAVAGLNPHCSENGLFGDEEEKEIIPAIEEAKREGIIVEGPFSPDTVFVKCQAGQYDIVVAMYHDQGHIPLKLNGFQYNPYSDKYESVSGINCTIGLPIVRTSVDHGTAFGKAGEGRANEESMLDAIFAGVKMAEYRFGK